MDIRPAVVAVASIVGLGACTTAQSSPATIPSTTEGHVTSTTSPTTTTTTSIATTTTLDRLSEIQAIFQDLEVRRLQAIMDQDAEAFRAVFANAEYEERSIAVMELVPVVSASLLLFEVTEVFADQPACIAVAARVDMTGATEGGAIGTRLDYVIELEEGLWGLSWTGEGWRCDGPHPFSD